LTNTKDYNKRYFYGTYVSNSYIRRLYCIRVSFGVDANSNLRTSWDPQVPKNLLNTRPYPYTYRELSSIMPQRTRNQNRGSTGCRREVIVALAAVGGVRSGAGLLGWSGEGVPGADCICRAGSDVDCDCDCGVCDMENPLSRSEFLL